MIRLQNIAKTSPETIQRLANNHAIAINTRDAFPYPYTIEDADTFLKAATNGVLGNVYGIYDGNTFVGCCSLIPQQDVHCINAEIGYWIGEPYWNKGYATETVKRLLNIAFKELNLLRVYASIFEYNRASMRVLEKNGFQKEAIIKASIIKGGKIVDEHLYSIRKDEKTSEHIINKLDIQDIVDVLSDKLSGSELSSVLLDVFDRRTKRETPASLLSKYETNKLVKPIDLDIVKIKEYELYCYKALVQDGFEPLELSPVAQMGTCSVVATVNQKKVLSALRNTEVQADPTNATALHYASLRKKRELENRTYNYCNISRIIRTQAFPNPIFTPHFSVLCLTSCGRDTGSFGFEKDELLKQMFASHAICRDIFGLNDAYFEVIPCKGYDKKSPLIADVVSYIRDRNKQTFKISVVEPDHENNYYKGYRIKLKVVLDHSVYEIGDGGLLDWTQQFLENKKERMLTLGLGFQIAYKLSEKYGKR